MRVVFMGTPQLAATVLARIAETQDVVGVFTRPDAVRGRGKELEGSPVKIVAEQMDAAVFTPTSFHDANALQQIEGLSPDVICVAAYGMLLPKQVLDIPAYGCLNVHTSLLPRWRGAAPIQRAILAGDDVTGVCIMRMEEQLDTGSVCKRSVVDIGSMALGELEGALAEKGASLLDEALEELPDGTLSWTEQSCEGITYAQKIERGELNVSPDGNAGDAWRKVRASSKAHPSKATISGKRVTLEEVALPEDVPPSVTDVPTGHVAFAAKRLFLGMQEGLLEVKRLKPDGKKSMDATAFAAGIQGIKKNVVTWESA